MIIARGYALKRQFSLARPLAVSPMAVRRTGKAGWQAYSERRTLWPAAGDHSARQAWLHRGEPETDQAWGKQNDFV